MDRIGPDLPLTQIPLYSKILMRQYCKRKFMKFGEGSEFRPGAYAIGCSCISIGDYVTIRPQSMLFAGQKRNIEYLLIEDNVLIGSGVHIYCGNHIFEGNDKIKNLGHIFKKITIEKDSWIGANCIILSGITIGEGSVIGAGSIVTKNVPPFTIAYGNPIKIIRKIKHG